VTVTDTEIDAEARTTDAPDGRCQLCGAPHDAAEPILCSVCGEPVLLLGWAP
jgi:hypothetical protein